MSENDTTDTTATAESLQTLDVRQAQKPTNDAADYQVDVAESSDSDGELEKEAKSLGWDPDYRPKKKYQKSFTATEFLQHRETISERKKLQSEIDALKQQVGEQQNYAVRSVQQLEHEQRNKEIAAIKARQRQAVRDGDEQLYDQLEKHKEVLTTTPLRTQPPQQQQPAASGPSPIMRDFLVENPWYQSDSELQEFANFLGTKVSQEGYTGQALLKEVARRVKQTRPDKFSRKGSKESIESVEVGGSARGVRLPPEIKEEHDRYCESMVKAKIVKSKSEASKRFLETYKSVHK